MRNRLLQLCVAQSGWVVALLLLLPATAFAQNTGKLNGRVIDTSTGEGLPGATVVVVGTQLGTATDVDGNYFILGVPVGSYDIQASFVGYQAVTVSGVEINAGYTREQNFELSPGVQLDEIVVEYERPLIQKDAIGVPKIVNAEEIVNLPVRGAANVASIQAGVVSQEGSSTLNVRGGRGSEVTYYIDGVKVIGTTGLPQSAIQEQEMLIGAINARYGDVMSGVISITTKAGSPNFFGSLEGITSQALDSYGYNLASGTIGGPIVKNKLSFFLSGEYTDQVDSNPRAFGELHVSDSILDDLRSAPIAFPAVDANGNDVFLPIPAGLSDGATLMVDNDGNPITTSGALQFSDGTTVAIPGNVDPSTIILRPKLRAEQVTDFTIDKKKRKGNYQNLSLAGNLSWNLFENGRLRVGGRYNTGEWDGGLNGLRVLFAADEMSSLTERDDYQVYGTWTQYLSNSTFYQVQADFSANNAQTYDPRFGPDFSDFLRYGDVDGEAAFATLRGYKDLSYATETRVDDGGTPDDPSDDTEIAVEVPTYNYTYHDGSGPATSDEVVSTMVQVPGGRFQGYGKSDNQQFRLTASATTQIGLNQLEFGAEYEQRTQRSWGINAAALSRFVNDASGPEQIANDDPDLNPNGYNSYDEIPTFVIEDFVGTYYGFDVRGKDKVNSENLDAFINQDRTKPDADYNIAPYEPIYYGGYVQDKIEFRDIVLNLGLRVDVFDNNTRVFKDRFARRPVMRAGDLGISLPATIDPGDAVYFSGDEVVGYRDLGGTFYTPEGQEINAGDILLIGKPRQTDAQITDAMFEDYQPEVTVMPRIGVSFPVTDQALFFASYGVVSQRPSTRNFATLEDIQGTGGINNTNLRPEKTTKYELGFRQRLGARAAFTISGFFHQIENLIQIREVRGASPSVYTDAENVDFGTVKGIEFGFDLRRTNGISANANYTLSFADGTGSQSATTGTIVWVDETPPNFISPLDFDQRHKMNISLDYRLGSGEGPTIFGTKLLENFGVNLLATAGSGFPYTPVVEPFNLAGAARAAQPRGGINSARMPWQSRVDLRVDRRFPLGGGSSVTAFLWVQNLFDQTNTNNVWRFTGLPDDDGFLDTAAGVRFLGDKPPGAEQLYRHRNRLLGNVGIPRLTRLGVRVDF